MPAIASHPQRNTIHLQLSQNVCVRTLGAAALAELEALLEIVDVKKGAFLVTQGANAMEHFFILEGILKRVVSNSEGKEMILRIAAEQDIDTSYAAWRMKTPIPYSIVALTNARVAKLTMEAWVAFLERHAELKADFDFQIMHLMSEVMAHTITLHLLDAYGRLERFQRKQAALLDRIPKKELAAYLNITPETLSRLKHHS